MEIGFNMVMSSFTENNEVVDVEIYKQGLTTLVTVVNVTSVCDASGMQLLALVQCICTCTCICFILFVSFCDLMQKGLTLTPPWLNLMTL